MYRIIATMRNSIVKTWKPVTSVFTDRPMPNEHLRVNIIEKCDSGWRDVMGPGTSKFFKQDERSITSIDKCVFNNSIDLLYTSMQIIPYDGAYLY